MARQQQHAVERDMVFGKRAFASSSFENGKSGFFTILFRGKSIRGNTDFLVSRNT
jgi:hypothetical protein